MRNGKKVDESLEDPLVFRWKAGEVIKGWDLGLQGMKVGGRRRLVVPPVLGYGKSQTGDIPPNSTLLFDVELKDVY